MTSVPLHPALVHVPLGLAFILPAVAVGLAWALWKDHIQPRAWLIIVLLEAVLLGAGLLALKTGQQEGERVKAVVPETAVETHETRAEQFLWITAVTFAAASAVLIVRRPPVLRALTLLTVIGTFLAAGAAFRVGHAGGQLVYVHNAAAAYAAANKANPQAGEDGAVKPLRESRAASDSDGAK